MNIQNPICRVCITEQPDINVCLSVIALRDQSLRYHEYEKKGKFALGSILSLSTAILNQKQLEKGISKVIVQTERNALLKVHGMYIFYL